MVLGLALSAGLTAGTVQAGAQETSGGAEAFASARSEILTLITGDQLRVAATSNGLPTVTVLPGAGRESVTFHRIVRADRLSVIPSDALGLIQAGRLDERLFDVTGLIEQGFGDSGPLPLILSYTPGAERTLADPLSVAGAEVVRELPSLDGVAVRTDPDSAEEVWDVLGAEQTTFAGGVERVWLNGRARVMDEESNAQIGAPEAWEGGFTGAGATVAVLDTGIDAEHPDLADVVVAAEDFTGNPDGPKDGDGHGTHVAGTIAGTGAASDGAHRGVAPDAELLIGKVCGDDGFCTEDAIIAGMEWAAEQGVDAANLSLGGGPTDGTDPMSLAVNALTEQSGVLYVIAAGNFGADETVSNPASADAALAVASVTKSDELSSFSSRGPRVGDKAIKPEIAAPGSDILSARAAGTPGSGDYTSLSGTSMASPHVAGAAAVLAAQHPDWQAEELKAALTGSSVPLEGIGVTAQGAGRLDLAAAVSTEVLASPSSLSLGVFPYPQTEEPVTHELTYRNTGGEDVTFDLTFEPLGPDGAAAPDGLFSLSADQVTVPAGGEATVELTVDPSVNEQTGFFGGSVLATSVDGETTVSTAAGAFVEPESYDLSIEAVTQSGAPAEYPLILAADRATGDSVLIGSGADGDFTARLPAGTYDVLGVLDEEFEEDGEIVGGAVTHVVELGVDVTSDATITLDGTQGVLLTAETERETIVEATVVDMVVGQNVVGSFDLDSVDQYAVPTGDVGDSGMRFVFRPMLGSPEGADEVYGYNLVFEETGIPESPSFVVKDAELARVQADYRTQGLEASGSRGSMAILPADNGGFGIAVPIDLPAERLEFFTPGDITWIEFLTFSDLNGFEDFSTEKTYEVGESTATWNSAPLGVGVGTASNPAGQRLGDEIFVSPGVFAPSGDPVSYLLAGDETRIAGATTLTHDGEVIGTQDGLGGALFSVPAGDEVFTLDVEGTRDLPWSAYGTEIDASWTFSSDTVDAELPGALPLLGVGFDGEVNELGQAPAGVEYPLAVQVNGLDGEPTELSMEVSYDDGVTWTAVEVTADSTVLLEHPAEDGFVSLRASAADGEGNSVEQTMLRAYGITAG
ncbi:subtilisin family serine protease [Actinoalloteichus hoggarensis]|uniref:S8 family peptidase n=1 Tax=Actinoalloteichus hoggarensis TaxID=1470176 RepID=UPI0012FDABB8|nr:S8 family serine peptidase [Actinoalloteichus hoggarensis]MBB5920203.1 subtilisin family serine protease [Actinoalloteichus hoggarensis]